MKPPVHYIALNNQTYRNTHQPPYVLSACKSGATGCMLKAGEEMYNSRRAMENRCWYTARPGGQRSSRMCQQRHTCAASKHHAGGGKKCAAARTNRRARMTWFVLISDHTYTTHPATHMYTLILCLCGCLFSGRPHNLSLSRRGERLCRRWPSPGESLTSVSSNHPYGRGCVCVCVWHVARDFWLDYVWINEQPR